MFRDNWVKWGFGDDLSPDFDPNRAFVVDWSAARPDPAGRDCLALAMDAARHIASQASSVPVLLVSGGVDSQAMAYAFKQSGVQFKAVFARYPNGLNRLETETFAFYLEHGIPVDFMDIDIVSFHESEMFDWAKRYLNNSPHFLSHMKIISSFSTDTVVCSGCILNDYGLGMMNWTGFGLQRYAEISNPNLIGYFLNYDPYLVWEMYNLVIDEDYDLADRDRLYAAKVALYRKAGFPVWEQRQGKMHGFEMLKELTDTKLIKPHQRLRYISKASRRPYDILYRYPLEDLVPPHHNTRFIYPDRSLRRSQD